MSAAATDFEENEEEEEKEEDDDDDFDGKDKDEDVVEEEEDLRWRTARGGGKRKGHITAGDEASISRRLLRPHYPSLRP